VFVELENEYSKKSNYPSEETHIVIGHYKKVQKTILYYVLVISPVQENKEQSRDQKGAHYKGKC
jgi:hypothetical protein